MARTTVTPVATVKNSSTTSITGVSPTGVTTTDGFVINNAGSNVLIIIQNTHATGTVDITTKSIACSHGRTGDVQVTNEVPVNNNIVVLGPFDNAIFQGSTANALDIEVVTGGVAGVAAANVKAWAISTA